MFFKYGSMQRCREHSWTHIKRNKKGRRKKDDSSRVDGRKRRWSNSNYPGLVIARTGGVRASGERVENSRKWLAWLWQRHATRKWSGGGGTASRGFISTLLERKGREKKT